jgi:hypothetical protein
MAALPGATRGQRGWIEEEDNGAAVKKIRKLPSRTGLIRQLEVWNAISDLHWLVF